MTVARLAPLLLLGLTGCATGSLDCADLRQGACKVSFQRFLTDTSATFTGPEGLGFTYGSNPNAQATAEAFAAINRLAGLVGSVAAGRLPVPPPEPLEPEESTFRRPSAIHGPLLTDTALVCPLGPAIGIRRVTASTPWMVEGLAQAGEVEL